MRKDPDTPGKMGLQLPKLNVVGSIPIARSKIRSLGQKSSGLFHVRNPAFLQFAGRFSGRAALSPRWKRRQSGRKKRPGLSASDTPPVTSVARRKSPASAAVAGPSLHARHIGAMYSGLTPQRPTRPPEGAKKLIELIIRRDNGEVLSENAPDGGTIPCPAG